MMLVLTLSTPLERQHEQQGDGVEAEGPHIRHDSSRGGGGGSDEEVSQGGGGLALAKTTQVCRIDLLFIYH